MNVCEAVTIDRPAADLYREWRNLESLPARMQHVESVQELSDGTSHWAAALQQIREDLRAWKRQIETGEVATTEGDTTAPA